MFNKYKDTNAMFERAIKEAVSLISSKTSNSTFSKIY